MTAHALAEDRRARKKKSYTPPVILVVDDDGETREMAAIILEELGYRVLQADSGVAALEVAAHRADEIDLLLTDVRMPGMNGVELAKAMSTRLPGLPVLFVSGYAAGALAEGEGLSERAAFLSKPFSVDDLDHHVREVLGMAEGR